MSLSLLMKALEQVLGLASPAFEGSGPWLRAGTRREHRMDLAA